MKEGNSNECIILLYLLFRKSLNCWKFPIYWKCFSTFGHYLNQIKYKLFNENLAKKVIKNKTIHTSRTIMFAEFAKIMDYALHDGSFLDALNQNVINKKTKSGINKTTLYLKTLYGFDINQPTFKALKYFWEITDEKEKSILAFLYALGNDYLLAESFSVIAEAQIGNKLDVEKFEENIDAFYPNRYTEITRRSIAKNIASSWKQAGFIIGKFKNIRTQPVISYNIVAFAFFLAYLNELRGEFI